MPRLERCKENRLLQNIQHTGRACRAINKQAQREEESKVKKGGVLPNCIEEHRWCGTPGRTMWDFIRVAQEDRYNSFNRRNGQQRSR